MALKQKDRLGQLHTALGKDALVLLRFEGNDHVNDLFRYEVDAIASDRADLDQLVGTHATVEIATEDHGPRFFDGIVTQARWTGDTDRNPTYRLVLEPWFALLRQRRNQRIFHEKTVVEILTELLEPYGAMGQPAHKMALQGSYPVLEYTVQYRESDLDFARRMMERFGISFHFSHDRDSHTLEIFDTVDDCDDLPGTNRDFIDISAGHDARGEIFWRWQAARHMTTGAVRLTDFNFKQPAAQMEVDRTGDATYAHGAMESYDYPGGYLEEGDGKDVVARRVTQERGGDNRHEAEGDCLSLGAGMKVKLTGQAAKEVQGETYFCLSAHHVFAAEDYASGTPDPADFSYRGAYVFTAVSAPYAAPRVTPLALVHGPQTATVVGEGEIDCDDYGRILVHFHWDLDKAHSMRCRVSQNWAGNGWGGMIIPRIGMEVVVEFLEGDPDKPLVTGCVYNGKNDVPYDLPAHKTRSTFKTDTHKGEGFNELRFEDEKGKEEIYVHAQRDRNAKIENSQTERVNVNKVESVGHDKASEVSNNLTQVAGGNMELKVGPGNIGSITPSGVENRPEGMPTLAQRFGAAGSSPGDGDLTISVERNKTQTIGSDHTEDVGQNKRSTVGSDYKLQVGQEIEITAGDRIILNVGQSRIVMEDNGKITLNGATFNVNLQKLIKMAAQMIKLN